MRMATADRVTALVLAGLGLAMLAGGWTMDRLEIRQIHPASIPGLVPMILGGLLTLCAALLWRSAEAGAAFMADGSWRRLAITGGLTLAYALGLVGTLPFLWATFVFVAAFALVFSWAETTAPRAIAFALGLGAVVAVGTSALFSEVFLVRLP